MVWQNQFLLLFTACGAMSTLGSNLDRRDITAIQNTLETINEGLRRVDIATIALQNGTGTALQTLESDAVPLLVNATAIIRVSPLLNLQDSNSLGAAAEALRSNLLISINDFIAQEPLLAAAGQKQTILQALVAERNSTLDLTNTLSSKLDPAAGNTKLALSQIMAVLCVGSIICNFLF